MALLHPLSGVQGALRRRLRGEQQRLVEDFLRAEGGASPQWPASGAAAVAAAPPPRGVPLHRLRQPESEFLASWRTTTLRTGDTSLRQFVGRELGVSQPTEGMYRRMFMHYLQDREMPLAARILREAVEDERLQLSSPFRRAAVAAFSTVGYSRSVQVALQDVSVAELEDDLQLLVEWLSACIKLGDLHAATEALRLYSSRLDEKPAVFTRLLDGLLGALCGCGDVARAQKLFCGALSSVHSPPLLETYQRLQQELVRQNFVLRSFRLHRWTLRTAAEKVAAEGRQQQQIVPPSQDTVGDARGLYGCYCLALAKNGSWAILEQLWAEMDRRGIVPDARAHEARLLGLRGDRETAKQYLHAVPPEDRSPAQVTHLLRFEQAESLAAGGRFRVATWWEALYAELGVAPDLEARLVALRHSSSWMFVGLPAPKHVLRRRLVLPEVATESVRWASVEHCVEVLGQVKSHRIHFTTGFYNAILQRVRESRVSESLPVVWEEMVANGVNRNRATFEIMVESYLEQDNHEGALAMLEAMCNAGCLSTERCFRLVDTALRTSPRHHARAQRTFQRMLRPRGRRWTPSFARGIPRRAPAEHAVPLLPAA